MKKAMVISMGTGNTVEDGISFSIRRERPDYIVFLVTRESCEKTLPRVLEATGWPEEQCECVCTTNENDVEKCVANYTRAIAQLRQKGYQLDEIVCDFTSGTKVMSSALVVAGLEQEVGSLAYVYGERGENGRVKSGTERMMSLEPRMLLARKNLSRAVGLFNEGRFNTCIRILEEMGPVNQASDSLAEAVSLVRCLAQAYQAWDCFAHEAASDGLVALSKKSNLLPSWGLKKKVETHKQILFQLLRGDYNEPRLVDLWNNIERRAEEGRFDDAVARVYRLLEYAAQMRLYTAHDGLLSGDVDTGKLPDSMKEDIEQKRNPRSGKVQLELVAAFELLEELGDDVGTGFREMWARKENSIQSVLGLRNNSILAHGFSPVGEEGYQKARTVVAEFLGRLLPDWEKAANQARFPLLPGEIILQEL